MRWIGVWLYLLLAVCALFFNLLGLLNLYPVYVTAPALFLTLFIPVYLLNKQRRRAK
ncbi:hypothetical protein [Bacillus thermotolerans]|uniref:Uncharacterized protein n=1 Tax=Bacillus thermotolerans TaxID=1221996 RepID=A0A0F5HZ51_BACTR|nr:hypothetical protein [Bacillus thermotolerans]KKB38112.1 hypothetical protein QY97_03487 [Bacillus thermotolerans]KKB40775.1 hypothetical protein QY95_01349 [Bacillus thermotolerans]